MSYYWNDPDLATELVGADAIEVAGVADLNGESMERVDDAEYADLFSIYVHKTGQGAMCIADRDTYDEALSFAKQLSERLGLTLYDFT